MPRKPKLYKVGIIGCGFIGVEALDNHANAYRECPDTVLSAVCDIDASKMKPFVGIQQFQDYLEMVKAVKLDIVSICTSPDTHCEITCKVAPFVKAIYCEKPIALTLEDADKMIETCRKKKTILQINHQRLFMRPVFRYSRGIINTGTHMFSLIKHLFRDNLSYEIQRVDTDEPIFELDCTHNDKPMILEGVKHLVMCLRTGRKIPVSSGEKARMALALALQYQRITGCD